MNDSTPIPPVPVLTPTNPAAPSNLPSDVTAPPGTALQIAQMLAAGKIDTPQAGKLARAGGFSALQVAQSMNILCEAGAPQEPNVRSPEVKALDQQFPAGKPADYVTHWTAAGDPTPLGADMKQLDASSRAWLSGAEFPRELGNSLVSHISRVAQRTQHMSPDELIADGEAEFVKLQQAHGPKLEEKLRQAGELVEVLEAKSPGLKSFLRSNGVGDSAVIANLLIQQAQRYWARRR